MNNVVEVRRISARIMSLKVETEALMLNVLR